MKKDKITDKMVGANGSIAGKDEKILYAVGIERSLFDQLKSRFRSNGEERDR